jgi:clan AA aspartic protease
MAQESGSVNDLREAIVGIRFVQGEAFECVVDTGFDGALILPAPIVESLRLPIVARLVFELVGGARMTADVALGEIKWLGEVRSVEVIISQSNDALIGTEMFEGTKLVLDYVNHRVAIIRDE